MMWTPTCPLHTFVSETIKDVSWTGCIFLNVYSCLHKHMWMLILSNHSPLSFSSNWQHFLHGGKRGFAGPDGADRHL